MVSEQFKNAENTGERLADRLESQTSSNNQLMLLPSLSAKTAEKSQDVIRHLGSAFIVRRLDYCLFSVDCCGRLSLRYNTRATPSTGRVALLVLRSWAYYHTTTSVLHSKRYIGSPFIIGSGTDWAGYVHCIHCPEYINDVVAPVASNPGRQQLRSAARSDSIETKLDSLKSWT